MRPGDTVPLVFGRRTIAGVASTGKVLADHTISAYYNGASASVSPTLTELGTDGIWQRYKLAVVVPAGEGTLDVFVQPATGTDIIDRGGWGPLEIETYDLTSMAAILASPVVSVVDQGGPQGDINLRLVKNTYAPISFTARTQDGVAIDLSTWNTPIFAIKSQDQSTTTYSLSAGITMTAGGLVTIAVPETATFYTALTTGVESIDLYWTFVANEGGDATKTRCLARGKLSVVRTEV